MKFTYTPLTEMERLIYNLLDNLKQDNPTQLNTNSILRKYPHITKEQAAQVLDRWNKQ